MGALLGSMLLVLSLKTCCYHNHVSTDIDDYDIKEVNRNTTKYYYGEYLRANVYFVQKAPRGNHWAYHYSAKEEQLMMSGDGMGNRVPGTLYVAHFQDHINAVAFCKGLIVYDPEIDFVILIDKKVYALDDDGDILSSINAIEEFVTQGRDRNAYFKYESIDSYYNDLFRL